MAGLACLTGLPYTCSTRTRSVVLLLVQRVCVRVCVCTYDDGGAGSCCSNEGLSVGPGLAGWLQQEEQQQQQEEDDAQALVGNQEGWGATEDTALLARLLGADVGDLFSADDLDFGEPPGALEARGIAQSEPLPGLAARRLAAAIHEMHAEAAGARALRARICEAAAMCVPAYGPLPLPRVLPGREVKRSTSTSKYVYRPVAVAQSPTSAYSYDADPPRSPSPPRGTCRLARPPTSASVAAVAAAAAAAASPAVAAQAQGPGGQAAVGKSEELPPAQKTSCKQPAAAMVTMTAGVAATAAPRGKTEKMGNRRRRSKRFLLAPPPILATPKHMYTLHLVADARKEEAMVGAEKLSLPQHAWLLGGSERAAGQSCSSVAAEEEEEEEPVLGRDPIPERIAGDSSMDAPPRLPSNPLKPLNVWRSVGPPKEPLVLSSSSAQALSHPREPGFAKLPPAVVANECKSDSLGVMDGLLPVLVQQMAPSCEPALRRALSQLRPTRCPCCGTAVGPGPPPSLAPGNCLPQQQLSSILWEESPVSAGRAWSIIHNDIGPLLARAFGAARVQGPLSAHDWCRGSCASPASGLPDSGATMAAAATAGADGVVDPITPPQGVASPAPGPAGGMLSNGSVRMEDAGGNDSPGSSEREGGLSSVLSPTTPQPAGDGEEQAESVGDELALAALPVPAILVGYQDDWLTVSPAALALWEKAPLEPYSTSKPVSYVVLCPDNAGLLQSAQAFFHQLSTVYETCRLGAHVAAPLPATKAGAAYPPEYLVIPIEGGDAEELQSAASSSCHATTSPPQAAADAYCRVVRATCQHLRAFYPSQSAHRDINLDPSPVVYVVSPWEHYPSITLKLLAYAAQGLTCKFPQARQRPHQQLQKEAMDGEKGAPSWTLHMLQVSQLLQLHGHLAAAEFREIAFRVYSSVRRISRSAPAPAPPPPSWAAPPPPVVPPSPNTKQHHLWPSTAESLLPPATADAGIDGRGGGSEKKAFDLMKHVGSTAAEQQQQLMMVYEPLFILTQPGRHSLVGAARPTRPPPGSSPPAAAPIDPAAAGAQLEKGSMIAHDNRLGDSSLSSSTSAAVAAVHCCYTWVGMGVGVSAGSPRSEAATRRQSSSSSSGSGGGGRRLLAVC
eukprot:jgi/Mesen1/6587/ME000338S05763